MNNCGPFVGYLIYGTQDLSQPFELLTTITDVNQDSWYHAESNSASTVWHYYLVSDYNCPGETAEPSEIFQNQDPEFPEFRSVSVEDGLVVVSWYPSTSVITENYIVFRSVDGGNFDPVATLPATQTSYTDPDIDPVTQVAQYTIVAEDGCEQTSIFNTDVQSNFILTTSTDECDQSITLTWTDYNNYVNGLDDYQIYVSINGSPSQLVDSTTGSSYTYPDATDIDEYCFTIGAKENVTDVVARSNEVCLVPDVVEAVDFVYLLNASYNTDGSLEVSWLWDDAAELTDLSLDTGMVGSPTLFYQESVMLPLQAANSLTLPYPTGGPLPTFTLTTTDLCGATFTSNAVTPVRLRGSADISYINRLEYTPFGHPYATNITYEVYRIQTNGSTTLVDTDDNGILTFIDRLDPDEDGDANLCYTVVAVATLELPDGEVRQVRSRSNTICLAQKTVIWMPNAFKVGSATNGTFKPLLVYEGQLATYTFVVYDRWGGEVFATTNPADGWQGRKDDGRPMPQGVYTYRVVVEQADGSREQRRGTVMLLP